MGEKLNREDLTEWAETLDAVNAPYSSQVQAENYFFVTQLEKREGTEIDEIIDAAQQDSRKSQHESKKWKNISWGSLAAGIGINIFSGGTVGLAALVGGFAGMMYGGSRSSKEQQNVAEGEHFITQLNDVGVAIERDSDRAEQPSAVDE